MSRQLPDDLVVEYMPQPEMNWIKQNPLTGRKLTNADEIHNTWGPLNKQLIADGHTLTCLDPAHGMEFLGFRLATLAPIPVAIPLICPILSRFGQMPQVDLLGILGLSVGTVLGIAGSVSAIAERFEETQHRVAPIQPFEAGSRRVIVARGLTQLDEPHAVVYPRAHLQGIEQKLRELTRLNIGFNFLATLKHIPGLTQAFFQGRTYKGFDDQGNPKLDQVFEIQ